MGLKKELVRLRGLINNVASMKVLAPSTLPWGARGCSGIHLLNVHVPRQTKLRQPNRFILQGRVLGLVCTNQFGAAARILRSMFHHNA